MSKNTKTMDQKRMMTFSTFYTCRDKALKHSYKSTNIINIEKQEAV